MREAVVTAIEVKPERSASRHLRESLKQRGIELIEIGSLPALTSEKCKMTYGKYFKYLDSGPLHSLG